MDRKQKGFTLVELLIVIAIIGLLVGMVVISVRNVKSKSRDAQRVSDLKSIETTLNLYHNDNSAYPVFPNPGVILAGTDAFSVLLGATGYITRVPIDPLQMDAGGCGTLDGYYYHYQSDVAGTTYALSYCLETSSMQGLSPGQHFIYP